MTKAEEKRAAIVAQQEARELAERAKQPAGTESRPAGRKLRTNWAASQPFSGPRRGRPPKP